MAVRDRLRMAVVLVLPALMSGCAGAPASGVGGAEAPASFSGVLPSADGPGVAWRLDLRADGVFFLHRLYQDRGPDAAVDQVGRWRRDEAAGRVVLEAADENIVLSVGRNALRLCDREGRPIVSDLDYDLRRDDAYVRVEPRLRLRGMYSYMADAAVFADCASGLRLPVLFEGDNLALERAYLAVEGKDMAQPLLAEVEGRIVRRPHMEGHRLVDWLLVDEFLGLWPGEMCSRPLVDEALENTYWKLTRLEGRPLPLPPGREPHLVLRPGEGQVAGHGGCNAFGGGYELDGARIGIGPLRATRMACPPGYQVEGRFLAALERVQGWRVTGDVLELRDAAGVVLARFQAVHF
jgi:copper homeostasis protein (lipoprotein)